MGDRQRHRGEAFRRRVDDDHGVAFPGLARLLVADAAPQIHDLLATGVGAAGAAEFMPSREVVRKGIAYAHESTRDVSLDRHDDLLELFCMITSCKTPWPRC